MNYKIIIIIILIIILIILYLDIYLFDLKNHNYIQKNKCKCQINIFNTLHLGDHIFNTYYFNYIKNFIEENGIKINYYIDKMYHDQVKEFLTTKNVTIYNLNNFKGLNMSILNLSYKNNYFNTFLKDYVNNNSKLIYDSFYLKMFNETSIKLGFPIYMDNFIYNNDKLLLEYELLDDKYKNLDVLIINSIPRSFQALYDENKWKIFIYKFYNKNLKIATTLKVDDIPCTWDDKLSVFKIGALSTNSKIIIGINTGPVASLFNSYTLDYCKKIYLIDNRVQFSYHKIVNVSNFDELNFDEIITHI